MRDLNDIQLPDSLIADLYHRSIVSIGEEPAKVQPISNEIQKKNEPDPVWKSLGANRKNILLIVNEPSEHIGVQNMEFLSGILKACQLELDDTALINMNDHPGASASALTKFFNSRIVLLFGYDPVSFGLPMSFPFYQIQPFSGCSYLYSPSLQELQADKISKSKLWVCLRRLFNI